MLLVVYITLCNSTEVKVEEVKNQASIMWGDNTTNFDNDLADQLKCFAIPP